MNSAESNAHFLASYLASDAARGQIELAASGASASMVNISQATIMELSVPVPLIIEQAEIMSAIACEAGKVDALMTEAERAVTLLQERRAALISAAVTGRIDVRHRADAEAA